jgi:dihydroorotate dehydrogenase (NAD+) catalytic subunit
MRVPDSDSEPGSGLDPAHIDLSTTLAGLRLPDPVMTASGCAAAGRELAPFLDVSRLGAVVTKSIMREPRSGRPTPRMVETSSGMLNSIGLQGPGIDSFLANDLPWLVKKGARPVVSIAGSSLGEFAELARRVGQAPGVAAIEANISCPNVEDRGLVFACDPLQANRVIAAVRRDVPRDIPVIAKLSPDVTSIVQIAESVVEAGAGALSLVNTFLGLAMDPETLLPRWAASPAACPDRPSARWPCGASGRCHTRCPRCRSSASAASGPGPTPWSSSSRAPAPFRWAR